MYLYHGDQPLVYCRTYAKQRRVLFTKTGPDLSLATVVDTMLGRTVHHLAEGGGGMGEGELFFPLSTVPPPPSRGSEEGPRT